MGKKVRKDITWFNGITLEAWKDVENVDIYQSRIEFRTSDGIWVELSGFWKIETREKSPY